MKIGELAALTGVTPDTLRYYEKQGLIRPAGRTASRYRHYGDQAVNRIRFIKSAQSLGFALQDIAKLLPQLDQGQLKRSDIEVQLTDKLADIDARIARLQTLKQEVLGTLNSLSCAQDTALKPTDATRPGQRATPTKQATQARTKLSR